MVTKPTGGFAKPPSPAERAARLEAPGAAEFIDGRQSGTPPAPAQTSAISHPASYPWVGKSADYTKQKPFRIPENEASMLEFVAGTTFGETAQSIQLAGVRYMTAKLLREKGFTVHEDPKTGALTVVGVPGQ